MIDANALVAILRRSGEAIWPPGIVKSDETRLGIEARGTGRALAGFGLVPNPGGRRILISEIPLVEHLRSAGRVLKDCDDIAAGHGWHDIGERKPAPHFPTAV